LAKIRQAKSKAQKSMKAEVVLTLSKKDKQQLKELLEDFRAVTNAKEIKEGSFSITFL
jgi:hypothetical protein